LKLYWIYIFLLAGLAGGAKYVAQGGDGTDGTAMNAETAYGTWDAAYEAATDGEVIYINIGGYWADDEPTDYLYIEKVKSIAFQGWDFTRNRAADEDEVVFLGKAGQTCTVRICDTVANETVTFRNISFAGTGTAGHVIWQNGSITDEGKRPSIALDTCKITAPANYVCVYVLPDGISTVNPISNFMAISSTFIASGTGANIVCRAAESFTLIGCSLKSESNNVVFGTISGGGKKDKDCG
jgi:hypothetical protein